MKIAMLNTSDARGGAAVAARRLKESLAEAGVEVTMVVREKMTDDPGVVSVNGGWLRRKINRFRFLWERGVIFLNNGCTRRDLFAVSIADTGIDVSQHPEIQSADIIHLHWINQGFLSLRGVKKLLALGKPVVWTLHDMWPATGICHYAWTCEHYRTACGACPFLHSRYEHDLARRIQRKKEKIYTPGLQLVTVSECLAGKCRESALTARLPVQVIPNALDTVLFSPGDKAGARRVLGLPAEKKVLVMGAARIDNPVKGFLPLKEALGKISPEVRENVLLVLFGAFKDEMLLNDFPVAVDWRGPISSAQTLRDLYRAGDVFLAPSLEDNLPNTVMEALSCGTPVAGFLTGGIPELVDHGLNGHLAPRGDADSLARSTEWILSHPDPATLAENARKKVLENYTADRVAEQYLALYREIQRAQKSGS